MDHSIKYYSGVREDFLRVLGGKFRKRVLEVGCGVGDTGEAALKAGCCQEYYGVEISKDAFRVAKGKLTEVICGDIENIELPWGEGFFSALVFGEVLEHLVDPWGVLKKLRSLLVPNSTVLASCPNVACLSNVSSLIRGRWDYAESGVMDWGHLRWFTPATLAEMFTSAGYSVIEVKPLRAFGWKARILNALTLNRFNHLFWRQIFLHAEV